MADALIGFSIQEKSRAKLSGTAKTLNYAASGDYFNPGFFSDLNLPERYAVTVSTYKNDTIKKIVLAHINTSALKSSELQKEIATKVHTHLQDSKRLMVSGSKDYLSKMPNFHCVSFILENILQLQMAV